MRVVITGSSGLIGSALRADLVADGIEVVRLVRRPPQAPDERTWDPPTGLVDRSALAGADVVVNLAGAGVGDHRWTPAYKREIRDSRVVATRAIAEAAARAGVPVLVSASAVGWYGDTGSAQVDETAPSGAGFLAGVVRDWEAAAEPARDAGMRVVHPRTGLVVAREGGAWARMFPLFRAGVGGRLGAGRQYWSWVSLRDAVRALRVLATDERLAGAVNVTGPAPATNADVTAAMGAVLHRPAVLPIPAFALEAVLGEFSAEVLGSIRAVPARLLAAGFTFADSTVESAIAAAWRPAGRG